MNDIDKLESRITAALDRIRQGVAQLNDKAARAALPVPEVDDEAAALRFQLQEEQTVNAQLEERVRALKERQDGSVSDLKARVDEQSQKMTALDTEIHRLRTSNADLRDLNAQMRSAAADGAVNPELINRATIAEVEALAAQRSADAAEMDAIITELKPLIERA
tara:strand:+ start:3731 stop:4222 length:492 start_codon:yes stop_codon:yes gene_type:complete